MSRTSAGVDGIPSALLKPYVPCPSPPPPPQPQPPPSTPPPPPPPSQADTIFAMATALHLVFSKVCSCQVPHQWRLALLSPIHKKGSLSDISNYRPLSVPSVSCRLWSSVLNNKLMAATDQLLPDSMFGFRPGRSCSDPLFVLRHMMDMRRAKLGKKFGAAFMDLSGAYDSIDRTLLFTKLRNLGMAEHTVALLESLYTSTSCIVKCPQGTAQPFEVHCGLRQGCPLSTTLFNLFIWDLPAYINSKCPGEGINIIMHPRAATTPHELLISDLGYADDCCLFGPSSYNTSSPTTAITAQSRACSSIPLSVK